MIRSLGAFAIRCEFYLDRHSPLLYSFRKMCLKGGYMGQVSDRYQSGIDIQIFYLTSLWIEPDNICKREEL